MGSASLAVNSTAAFSCCAIWWKPQTVQSLCGCSLHICAGLCFQSSSFSNGVINTLTAFLQGFCSAAFLIWVLEATALFSWVKMKWGKAAERSVRASTRCCLKNSDTFPSACPLSSTGSPPGVTYLEKLTREADRGQMPKPLLVLFFTLSPCWMTELHPRSQTENPVFLQRSANENSKIKL